MFSLFLTKAKKITCKIFILFFYRGPQKATLYDPTRIQPQIQFKLANYAITMMNLRKIYIFISLKQQRKHTIYKHKLNAI